MTAQLVKLEAAPDLVDQVYRALLDAISDGSMAPGQRITQEDIAERLAVSRQPVLQALRLLKKDGFVLDAPGRGVQVAPLDLAWIGKVYQVRGALDALAARLAAQHRYQIDPQLIEQGRKAARGRNLQAMIDADLAFHQAIYHASQNPLIEQSAHLHWRHLRRVMGAVLQSSRQRESIWDEHEAIAKAIAAGDAVRAVRLIDQHSHLASTNLTERLAQQLSNPSATFNPTLNPTLNPKRAGDKK
ncbi:MAG: GntR family transcriptional regulator [Bdellovibrionales bacterium]|nr:GntR family transcriptional regulator [Ramlibacter sp.]